MFGLLSILLASLIAVLGYLITPDGTPDANRQIVDIQLKSPGFSTQVLALRKNKKIPGHNWLKRMCFGAEEIHQLIPAEELEIKADSILLRRPEARSWEGYHIVDVLKPLDGLDPTISSEADHYVYRDLYGNSQKVSKQMARELLPAQISTKRFWLGTDVFGRDLLSRLLIGLRISLLVGLIAVVISLLIGISIGALGGYFGGRVDDVVMLLINTIWSIPTLLLVFAIVLALGKGITNIFLAVGLTMWVEVARIVRGQVMAYREVTFVEAARSLGFGHPRIIFRHILPNILGPILVIAAANFATAILIEAGLSYLGFGIEPPQPSWGTMLNENYGYALSGKPFIALVPALAIMWLVLAFNLLGNGLRDAFDVKKEAG